MVGRTTEGRPVVAGAFWLVARDGIPLDLVVSEITRAGLVIDWLAFHDAAVREGWNPRTIRARIELAVGDVLGPEHRDQVMRRLRLARGE